MKNIWIMNHYATDMFRDKAGRHFWFATILKKEGFLPTVFCSSTFHNREEGVDIGRNKAIVKCVDSFPFVFVKTSPSIGNGFDRIKNMVIFYFNLFPVAKIIERTYGKPDVILASSVHPLTLVAGIKIAKKLKIPCICEIRDLWPEAIFSFGKVASSSFLGRILTAGEYWIYKNADSLIFTKEGDIDYLKEKKWDRAQGGRIDLGQCHYINNGVNLTNFERQIKTEVLKDKDLLSDGVFNVVYAGAIRPVNNVGNLLDCAKLLIGRPDIKFLIYGEGSELQALKDRIFIERITNVHVKGFIDRKYIPYILSHSSVNILNYSHDHYNWSRGNSSNKLFEYMASGKPIISTVKMGYSIINKYKCGFELDESTPQALANAIEKIHDLPPQEYSIMGKNAREGAKDFDFSILTQKLIQVIESVSHD